MGRLTRRTFMGMVAGSAAVAALPRRVLGLAVEPAGDLSGPLMPLFGDLKSEITFAEPVELVNLRGIYDLPYWMTVPSDMVYFGIDRTKTPFKPPNGA